MTPRALLALLVCIAPTFAVAKLPAPTPEEQAAAKQKKEQEAAQEAQQKKALDAAEDRVVQYYKTHHGSPASGRTASTDSATMPKKATELPGEAGPHGGRTPSAEAHSAPVR